MSLFKIKHIKSKKILRLLISIKSLVIMEVVFNHVKKIK